ncbi:MAG: protein kinase, partial [Planctomycetota bacterium]
MTGSSPLDSDRDRNDETIVRQRREGDTELGDARELEPPLVVGQKFGEYQILDLLGRGSSGFVYAAHDSVANRRLAIKVLCRNSPQDLCRNKLGFRRMSKLRHPRLLWAKGITQVERYCVLLMEEIEGYTLKKAIERISKLPKREAMHRFHVLLHDFATGLAVMHFNELVHRDLKPSNLMVRSDGRGVIVDYGLVAHCDTETDPRGIRSYIAGTPKYFSPEALWEQSYTPAGDVFSLGLVMLDCLKKIVGKEQSFRYGLFTEWDREEDERTIANLIADMDETIPPLLRMVIAEMLTQDRSERRSSMEVAAMTNLDDRPVRLKAAHHLFGRQDEMQACQSWIDAILKDGSGRLHLVGDAGAGKSSLLDDVERGLRQLRWGNVFRANCRSREIDRLQVMDQIADQVAQRYTRKDLKPLALHPVNVSVLVKAFPQLAHVLREIQVDEDQDRVVSFDCPLPERLDLVSAWGGLCQALLEAGPLFLIVDDAQWADTDGMKLLNDLQRAGMNSVGVITASREEASESAQTGTETLTIGPLNESAALAFLKATAERWGANINAAGLLELLDLAEGNPFRLRELAEEMRPEGLLHRVDDSTDASISNLGRSERLWQARLDRLSDDERAVLVLIVAAGTPVALADLAVLSGFGERTDGAVFELSRRRLVQDDATGQECIRIVGDAMTDGLIASFSEDDIREAHLCWAQLLSGQQRSKFLASRIAKHFYAA